MFLTTNYTKNTKDGREISKGWPTEHTEDTKGRGGGCGARCAGGGKLDRYVAAHLAM